MGTDALSNTDALCRRGIFGNTAAEALPQTAVADAITAHMSGGGTRRRRVLVYGLDGVRADCCPAALQDGGTAYIASMGTNLLSYAGGDPKHPETLQKTCTWQGWASILAGKWGIENGVVEFTTLRRDCPTALLKLARLGMQCSFIVVWPDHFGVTYKDEIEMARTEKINFSHILAPDEDALYSYVIERTDVGDDVIFAIVDSTDHLGHATGFSPDNPAYTKEIEKRDMQALQAIRHIESRREFANEDWLFIITTDHGGHDMTHFDQSPEDKLTFIASNKKEYFKN